MSKDELLVNMLKDKNIVLGSRGMGEKMFMIQNRKKLRTAIEDELGKEEINWVKSVDSNDPRNRVRRLVYLSSTYKDEQKIISRFLDEIVRIGDYGGLAANVAYNSLYYMASMFGRLYKFCCDGVVEKHEAVEMIKEIKVYWLSVFSEVEDMSHHAGLAMTYEPLMDKLPVIELYSLFTQIESQMIQYNAF